ncbi:COQ9 family protein [Limibacillus halophilus]
MNKQANRDPKDAFEERRRALLAAVVAQVPFDGWSRRALLAGAESLGISEAEALNLFPGGPAEMIALHSEEADRRMLRGLAELGLEEMKVRERIAAAVRLRLEQNEADREAVRKGLAFLALPQHAALATKLLYPTVDAMWLAAGDRSTDYNFYTKRLLLSGVYSSTLLVWLDDSSEGFEKTWAFLDRRIDNVLKVGGSLGKGMKRLLDLPDRLFEKRPRRLRSMR